MHRPFRRLLQKHQDWFVLGLLLFASLLLITLDNTVWMTRVQSAAGSVISFPEKGFHRITRLNRLLKENAELRSMMGEYYLQRNRYSEVIEENRRLRKMLSFQEQDYSAVPAEIIGRGSSGLPGSVHLDVGSARGVAKNMVLMTEDGVAGKILSAGKTASTGQLISDPNFRISAAVERSGALGVVEWLYGNICRMDLSRSSDVKQGDRIVTSAYSRIYPPGLVIGSIYEVEANRNNLITRVYLRTSVDLDAIEEVFIVMPVGNAIGGETQ